MPNRSKTLLGVVHVTATPPGWSGGLAGLRAMHKARGFSDIGYNEVILGVGKAAPGRGYDAVGAHVAGFNSIAYGLSMVGGIDAAGKADFSTVKDLLPTLIERMRAATERYPKIKWCGHRDLSPDKDGDGIIEPYEWMKECPTFNVIPWAAQLGFPVADIKGTWKAEAPLPGAPIIAYAGPDTRAAYLQRLLVKAGFVIGPVDGIVGNKTRAALKAFQKANGLTDSGAFDQATTARLRALYE